MADEMQSGNHAEPALQGIDAWAAAFVQSGMKTDNAPTIAGNCLRDGYDQGFAAGRAGLEPAPAPTATDHRVRSKLDALHIAIQHCAVSGQRDIDKITADAEKFWRWLVKEIN